MPSLRGRQARAKKHSVSGPKRARSRRYHGGAFFLSRSACAKRLNKTAKSRADQGKTGIVGKTRHRLHKGLCALLYQGESEKLTDGLQLSMQDMTNQVQRLQKSFDAAKTDMIKTIQDLEYDRNLLIFDNRAFANEFVSLHKERDNLLSQLEVNRGELRYAIGTLNSRYRKSEETNSKGLQHLKLEFRKAIQTVESLQEKVKLLTDRSSRV